MDSNLFDTKYWNSFNLNWNYSLFLALLSSVISSHRTSFEMEKFIVTQKLRNKKQMFLCVRLFIYLKKFNLHVRCCFHLRPYKQHSYAWTYSFCCNDWNERLIPDFFHSLRHCFVYHLIQSSRNYVRVCRLPRIIQVTNWKERKTTRQIFYHF